VWHLKPDVIRGWTRPTVIAHSQVVWRQASRRCRTRTRSEVHRPADAKSAAPDGRQELITRYSRPRSQPATPWLRYVYSNSISTTVNTPGLYVIEYAGQRTAPFPISRMPTQTSGGQPGPSTWRVQMDHVFVCASYRGVAWRLPLG